jgi:N-acetyl-anhydromuramyl-L-alanine amidase AmpD
MNIIQSICTQSDCYREGKAIDVKGLMIHSVGCPQPKAQPFINNWNKAGASACVHAIVEPDGDVYQLLPWNHRGWHGGGSSNNTHLIFKNR